MTSRRPLTELVHPSWGPALQPVEDVVASLGEMLRAEVAAGRGYLPSGDKVLRAFTRPLDDVRVLVVGQDPYPTPGHAVGLSFSVERRVRPLPLQTSQGCSGILPLPPQVSQGAARTICPNGVRVTWRSSPAPPQRSQVVIGVPGSAPLPWQCSQAPTTS